MKKVALYALGEIFLVVIGILIAVQLNNWNTNRKLELAENTTLDRLYDDLRSDMRRIQFLDSAMKNHIVLCDSVIRLINSQQTMEQTLNLIKIDAVEVFLLEPNTITYDEMINTGRLYTLQDRRIRRLINLYYRQLNKWERYSEENSNQVRYMINDPALRDYWVLQVLLWKNQTISQEKYPWLTRKNSIELKTIGHLMHASASAQRRNLRNYETIRGLGQLLLDALEERKE